jgi:magnesium transporter
VNPAVPPEAALRETRAVLGRIEAGRLRPRSPFELSYAIVSALAQGQEAFVESMVKHRGSAALLWNMARGSDD